MSNHILHPHAGNGNLLEPDFDTYREIVALVSHMQVSVTGNPRHFVTTPTGWRFAVDDAPASALVFGESPQGHIYLVDGVAAHYVLELLLDGEERRER